METFQNTQYKRTSRHPSEETRSKIASSLRGRPKSEQHKQAISASMVAYWGDDNNFPDDANGSGWDNVMEENGD